MTIEKTAWKALEKLSEKAGSYHLKDLFAADPARFDRYSLSVENILFDYSKNLVTDEIMAGLLALARAADIEGWRDKMFSGERINITENRPVLHVALRQMSCDPLIVEGINVSDQVKGERARIKQITEDVRSAKWRGYSGKRITDVVNIGIGGSNLGPQMVTEALQEYSDGKIRIHYVSNVDSFQITQALRPLNPEQVLFVISSKTFTTKETLLNATTARQWMLAACPDDVALKNHFVAVTANRPNALDFGLGEDNILTIWDWVGGRFSLWSAIGLPIALSLGFDNFEQLLKGASAMDRHFQNAPLESNVPVIQALVGIWNSNFLAMESLAILPYNQSMHMFPAYLQQADMESSGKSVDRNGNELAYGTGPVIWGQTGINGQHAFYQYLHQGKNIIAADFIAAATDSSCLDGHHDYLMANFFAQTQALMTGIDEDHIRRDLRAKGKSETDIDRLVAHKVHKGNRPTTTILLEKIDPRSLGALIAMYEHKIFTQGIIWQICSFDQWGVELGKELANRLLPQLKQDADIENQDSSTTGLINFYKNTRNKP